MNDIDVNRLLTQLRSLQTQATGSAKTPDASDGSGVGGVGGDFGSLLKSSLDGVSRAQTDAQKLQQSFELGDPGTDLSSVMLATSKAQVSFRGAVEVRNRLVSAYQDIMNMPL
jgi:flagellar hook-basal body complex protein FliE